MVVAEPGRSLVGAHGVLVAQVVQSKVSGEHSWLMIDAGMNDLLRPALYGAKHRIEPLDRAPSPPEWRVVGPVCESSDDFGAHPIGSEPPATVVIRDAGAYSFTMASEYNGRALASEVFVKNGVVVSTSPGPGASAWVKRRLQA
jgi:diaminopimelate decarboxylase